MLTLCRLQQCNVKSCTVKLKAYGQYLKQTEINTCVVFIQCFFLLMLCNFIHMETFVMKEYALFGQKHNLPSCTKSANEIPLMAQRGDKINTT